jgi:uncharacterized protein (TIGR03118 family)
MAVSSVYSGNVNHSALTKALPDITIPGEGPTGVVFNSTSDFVISDNNGHSGPATFIFVTEEGTIAGWNRNVPPPSPSTAAQLAKHIDGAVYKGVTIGNNGSENLLYAANFHTGHIDVFDTHFVPKTLTGSFTDTSLPSGFAPFNIQNLDGTLYVMYAQQDAVAHDEVDGPGMGFVDKFDLNGNLMSRFATGGALNAPWGIVEAPASFGQFSGDILVGNFGDGHINAFTTGGTPVGQLRDARGNPIAIDGLWALAFGNGVSAGDSNALYFTAGPAGESHGLFGKLTATTTLTEQTIISGPKLKHLDLRDGHVTGFLELHNHSKSTISGPITIIFDRLPMGVTLNNATGITAGGKPFVTLTKVMIAKHKKLDVFVDLSTTTHILGQAIAGLHQGVVVQGQIA